MLDLQTLTFASVISAIIAMLFFMVIWRLNTGIAGVTFWLSSSILFPVAMTILPLRHILPINISILLGNYLNIMAVLLFYLGTRVFWQKKNINKKVLIGFTLLFVPVFYLLVHVYPSLKLRVLLVYSIAAFIMFKTAALALNLPEKNKSVASKLLLTVSSIVTSLLIARIFLALSFDSSTTMYEINLSNVINVSLAYLVPTSFVFCALILLHERREKNIATLQQQTAYEAQLKDRYLSTLSHELRTPLNGIVGAAQILKSKKAGKEDQDNQQLNTIINAGQHLAELANKVLHYAAINHEKNNAITLSPVSLDELLNHLGHLFKPLASAKGLTLIVTKDPDIATCINSDHTLLKSVLTNLLSNAIKYTDSGHVSLSISLAGDKSSLTFDITDTGAGMTKEQFIEMQMPFRRGARHIQHHFGAGLGLTIVQDMLSKLNSQLAHIESQQGTHLNFALPYSIVEQTPRPLQHLESVPIEKLHILLVEDIELNIEILTNLLDGRHLIDVARNGQQAIEKLTDCQYDLVLLDIQLPDMTGFDVINSINTHNLNNTTPFLALTASVTAKEVKAMQECNFVDIVAKPIIKETLLNAIANSQSLVKGPTLLHQASLCSSPNLSFDPKPLLFLKENLPEAQFNAAVDDLINTYPQYISELFDLSKQNKKAALEKLSHQLANRLGQFGLIHVSETLKSYESGTSPSKEELTKLASQIECGANEILIFLQKQ